MAGSHPTSRRVRPLEVDVCHRWTIYTGTKQQLIEAGVVGADQAFPGDPGTRKTVAHFSGHPRRISTIRLKGERGNRFLVYVDHTEEQIKERDRREQAAGEYRAASQWYEQQISRLPGSHEAYRDATVGLLDLIERLIQAMEHPKGGYSWDADTSERLGLAVQAMHDALAEGTTHYDPAGREAEIAALRAEVSRKDADFGRFIEALERG